jgi:hypothetical protein
METPLFIPGTKSTPTVLFDPPSGRFLVIGNSLPEHAPEFYRPLLEWLERHAALIPDKSVFIFRLPYFNTSSMKALYLVLDMVQDVASRTRRHIDIDWHIEDEDEFMIEAAENLSALLKKPLRQVHLSPEESRAEATVLQFALLQLSTGPNAA